MTHCLLIFVQAFDEDMQSSQPSSTALSRGFLVMPFEASQGFRLVRTTMYTNDIVLLSNNYRKMQSLLDAVYRHAATVGKRINASKTKVVSALSRGEQRQTVFLDGEPLEGVDKFKCQGTEKIRGRIHLARSASSRLQSCLWSQREISLLNKRGG